MGIVWELYGEIRNVDMEMHESNKMKKYGSMTEKS